MNRLNFYRPITPPPLLSDEKFEGNRLMIPDVSESDMGGFLCIASNKVPPAMSKRVFMFVQCKLTHDAVVDDATSICVFDFEDINKNTFFSVECCAPARGHLFIIYLYNFLLLL
jgi:hypothetical protein